MLADGGVGAGIGVKRAEGDCFGDKMIFFYYIKLFVFFICQEDFFQSFGSDGGRHRFSLSIRRLEKELGCEVRLLFGRESRNKGANRH
jgi:hypothetical protein